LRRFISFGGPRQTADHRRDSARPRGRHRIDAAGPTAREKPGAALDGAAEALSDEDAQIQAVQLQASWGGRWQVTWEPWGRTFRAFPAYDMDVNTPVKGATVGELSRAVLEVDLVLLAAVTEAAPAQADQARRPRRSSSPSTGLVATPWTARSNSRPSVFRPREPTPPAA
jgi:hypothetical protein